MEAETEVVVVTTQTRPPATDHDLGRTQDLVDDRVEGNRPVAKCRDALGERPELVEESHQRAAGASADFCSVPASKRARVSARRTLPLVVRGIVPGAVTMTRSSSSPAVSRTRRRAWSAM